jgi:high affinity Mn2+ porin
MVVKASAAPDPDLVNFHGQTTFLEQGYPAIRSPYQGPNSLPGSGQGRETRDASLFAGVRLWRGAELWINPEIDQGFGLANTLGAAGFPSGEAYKVEQTPGVTRQRGSHPRLLPATGSRVAGYDVTPIVTVNAPL